VFMANYAKPTFHTDKDEDSVGIGGRQDRGCKIVARLKVDRD